MAHIKSEGKNHYLIQYRPGEGTYPKRERCPKDPALFERYLAIVESLRLAGRRIPPISEVFPEEFKDAAPAPTTTDDIEIPAPSLDEWFGDPPRLVGRFFHHAAAKDERGLPSDERMRCYPRCLREMGAHLIGRPMNEITADEAQRYIDNLHVCVACAQRAELAGRVDLLDRPDLHLLAVNPPWDGSCDDHWVAYQKTTIRDYRNAMRFAFEVAIWAGEGRRPREPRCASITVNEFKHVVLHDFEERETPNDHAFALNHEELRRIAMAMPMRYRVIVPLAAYGALRSSELLGLHRGNLRFPDPEDAEGEMYFVLTHTLRKKQLRRKGKNGHALGGTVVLPDTLTELLREYLDLYLSTPNIDACSACADGVGEHIDQRTVNPHSGCDFSDDTPLWIEEASGERLTYTQLSRMFKRAVRDAGLASGRFVPSLHTLRASGATALVEVGESIDSVKKHGRWSSILTLERHYLRPTKAGRRQHLDKLNRKMAAAWGLEADLDGDPDEQIANLLLAVRSLREQNEKLKAKLGDAADEGPKFLSKGWYTAQDIQRALEPARNMTELCRRLGLTGAGNTRNAVLRKMKEAGLEFPTP